VESVIVRLHRHDERLLALVVSRRRARLDRAVCLMTHCGGAVASIAVTVALLLVPVAALRPAGASAALTLALSHLLVQVLKRTVVRARPQLPVGALSLIHAPDRFSFPSGHAAASLSVALGLTLIVPVAVAPAVIALALLIGLSRCYLGVHYPTDVVAGWLLAIAVFMLVAR
jgi:undecaprenyl-diphosphatase